MSNSPGTIETIAQELTKLLQPLKDDLSPRRARVLFAELGFAITQAQVDSLSDPLQITITQTLLLIQKSRELATAIEAEDVPTIVRLGIEIIGLVRSVINSFADIRNAIDDLNFPGVTPAMIAQIPEKLFSYLLVRYLDRLQGVTPVLSFMGVLNQSEQNIGSVDPNNPPYTLSTFHFDQIVNSISKPGDQLKTLYQWGENAFDGRLLFGKLEDILSRAAIPVIYDDTTPIPKLDLIVVEATPKTDIDPKGIVFKIKNNFNTNFTFSENDFDLRFKVDFSPPVNTELLIQPNGNLSFTPPDATPLLGKVLFDLIVRKKTNPAPYIILGKTGGSRLEVLEFTLKSGADLVWQSNSTRGSFFIEGAISGGKILIDTSSGDGFLQKLLPLNGFESNFDIGFGFSSENGIYFNGSGALEIRLPVHIDIGPIEINGLTFAVKFKDGVIPVELGADIKAELGPLVVVVENIGLRASFSFPSNNRGNLQPLQMDIGFKPPNGLGLSINAGAVVGGGYLFFDFEKEEYAGVLELTIAGFISAKAIGLITTKMPDGSKGFSMLIIITAEFMPPFQLSFGFTLVGVGGLLGLNRTVLLDPLREGVRTGAVNSIMFPQNVIANAPRIISDLKSIFPPYEGKFLIGPMAKIGWGTPTLISLSLGLIIEIPGNLAILGVLKIALPEERIAVIQIQVLFVGTIDFDKKMITFDASLYESRILIMTLEGDMAVRLKWGDGPDFILTVGGFHPSYTPPPLSLPSLRRLAINILDIEIARIRVECYQAVTSNTVQFGCHCDMYFGFSAISISGHIGFDALFQFSPFHFIIQVSGSISLKIFGMGVFSISLRFSLEGPTPWRANGTGSISFFFFDVSADFDMTWGDSKNTSLPDIEILPRFIEEISKREQWSTVLSSNKNLLVSLRKIEETSQTLVLHPAGSLVVQQKLLPLTVQFDKIGNQKTSDVKKVSIASAASAGVPLTISNVDENFARAQYQNLSDAEKLSKPSFEKMPGGVTISMGSNSIKNGKMVRRNIEYETTIIDKEPKKPFKFGKFYLESAVLSIHSLNGNSASKSVLSKNYKEKLQPFSDKMTMTEEGYSVAFTSNNKTFNESSKFSSEAMAQDCMKEQVNLNPSLKKEIHIVQNFELN
ncbi:MAG: hypothetical protein M3R36_03995 [Bacteroidota bacterium]|nr:hypothetical protein [Bacteroidota bacterium]